MDTRLAPFQARRQSGRPFLPVVVIGILGLTAVGCNRVEAQSGSLQQLVQTFAQSTGSSPDQQGKSWKKWTVTGQPWNVLLAVSTGRDTTHADLLMAMKDSIPLLALVSTARNKQYQYLKIDKSLHNGWEVTVHALSGQGAVDWVELEGPDGKVFVGSRTDRAEPQFLAMPTGQETFLILSWDAAGEELETALLYDSGKKTIQACCNYALNLAMVRYLFLRSDTQQWTEFTYDRGLREPIAVALHDQAPGQLKTALIDLNRDGKMDLLCEASEREKRTVFKKTDALMDPNDKVAAELFKKELVNQAIKANRIWLKAQWLWYRLHPLGVQLPEVVRF